MTATLLDRLQATGIELRGLRAGENRTCCPRCARGGKDSALAVRLAGDRAVWICHRCGWSGATSADSVQTHRRGDAALRAIAQSKRERLSEWGQELWRSCERLDGVAQKYLAARSCVLPPAAGDLRWHPELQHPTGYRGPALVALVTDVETREPMTLHRTWIKADGTKADVDPPRMLLGKHRKAGGVIRLWPDEAVTYGLGVAEGIESALSLAHAYTPVWACIDAGNLGTLGILAGIETLVIATDHDAAGKHAARVCATRWAEAGRDVRLVMPPDPGCDLNDFARATA